MSVIVKIVQGPVTEELIAAVDRDVARSTADHQRGAVGAVLRFDGIVRREEQGLRVGEPTRAIEGLVYQTYEPMTERMLRELAIETVSRHALLGLTVLHSRGLVPVGKTSFVLLVQSRHRAEGFYAMTTFVDRMKQTVPIWKRPV